MTDAPVQTTSRATNFLTAVLTIGMIVNGYYAYRLSTSQRELAKTVVAQSGAIEQINRGIVETKTSIQGNIDGLQGDIAFAKERLGMTQVELRKTALASTQLAKQHKEATAKLGEAVDQLHEEAAATRGMVGSVSSAVDVVKTDLTVTNEQIASTRTDLQRMVGDLGVQSGLIARNHDELDELRARGERAYIEFDLKKTKDPQKVGTVSITLKKTDTKRQRFTMNLISDDRTIEKKEKTLNEPVQFYQNGLRQPAEIVVNQISKDRIVGYLSVPKQRESRPAMSENTNKAIGTLSAKSAS